MRALPLFLILAVLLVAPPARAQRFGLIARDGGSLRLVRHDLELSISHPLVESVVTQEFENRSAQSLEAFFHYPVPPGATVTGLALWVGDTRREARMLERQRAREIYDGIVREKRDPALLERVDGGFRIRIFPVLPRSRTRVELRFVEPVVASGADHYQVSVRRPPGEVIHVLRVALRLDAPFPIAEASLEGVAGRLEREGHRLLLRPRASQQSFTRDLELRYRRAGPRAPVALVTRHDGQAHLLAEIPLEASAAGPRRWALLLDGSRSMTPALAGVQAIAAGLAAELPDRDLLAVASFDLLPREALAPRPLDRAGRAEAARRIAALRAEGGSAFLPSFERALASGVDAIVCITDGGSRYHQEELEALLRRVVDRPGVRVFVLLTAAGANEELLSDLAHASGGALERFDARTAPAALARRIAARAVVEPGLEDAAPLRVIQRDAARLLVAGILPAASLAGPLTLGLRGGAREVRLVPREAGAAGRALRGLVAASAIANLMRRVKTLGESAELRAQVIALSVAHNVVSEYTALLATETDADYRRPTSGQSWQRMTPRIGDDLPSPSFQSTPEPHEWAMIALGAAILFALRRRLRPGARATLWT
jgi:hypothetical protein